MNVGMVAAPRGAMTSAEARESARDSVAVALWTAVSRGTGLVRVAVIGAVLGPTFLGNVYQFTNSVPNLVYYGLLGGSLVSSLLVPAMVPRIGAGDTRAAAAIAGHFLRVAITATVAVAPFVVIAVPLVVRLTSGASHALVGSQERAAVVFVVLLAPQVVCYGAIACSVAVMNAHKRFALAAAAPTIENVGTLVVLAAARVIYGAGNEVGPHATGEIVLLGAGTTGAVLAHAVTQWVGARRAGVVLVPRRGGSAEMRDLLRRSVLAMAQTAVWTVQVIVVLACANRVPGGVVAVMIALNFFFVPIALAATPVALAALPRLAAHHLAGRVSAWAAAGADALCLAIFVAVPAAVGLAVLAPGIADAVGFGAMHDVADRGLIASAVAAIAVGVVGYAVFTVATYLSYARGDARGPLRCMLMQASVAPPTLVISLVVPADKLLPVLTGGLGVGTVIGAALLIRHLALPGAEVSRFGRALARTCGAAAVMAVPVWLTDDLLRRLLDSRAGNAGALAAAILVGMATYVLAQKVLRSQELQVLTELLRNRRGTQAESQP